MIEPRPRRPLPRAENAHRQGIGGFVKGTGFADQFPAGRAGTYRRTPAADFADDLIVGRRLVDPHGDRRLGLLVVSAGIRGIIQVGAGLPFEMFRLDLERRVAGGATNQPRCWGIEFRPALGTTADHGVFPSTFGESSRGCSRRFSASRSIFFANSKSLFSFFFRYG